jgi:hypothetical protein
MSKLFCYFLDNEIDENPTPEKYSDFFINYHPSKWKRGSGDAVFSFEDNNNNGAVLSVIESEKLGISVRYNIIKSDRNENSEFYSVGDEAKINLVEDVGDDQFVPIGSFIEPNLAWLTIEDFLSSPLNKSKKIRWVNSKEIIGFPK